MSSRQKHEKLFSELSQAEMQQLSAEDIYGVDSYIFQLLGYDVEVRNSLIGEALATMTMGKYISV